MRSRLSVPIAAALFIIGSAALIAWRREDVSASALWIRMGRAPSAWPRRFTARVSWPTTYRVCAEERRENNDAVVERCQSAKDDGIVPRDLGRDARKARQRASATLAHRNALIGLVWNAKTAADAERFAASFEQAARDSATAPAALADLSAAYLVADAYEASAEHLLAAADAATRALQLDSSNAAARFNRALALDRLSLTGEAREAWIAYLKADSTSEWAAEARGRMNALIERSRPNPSWTPNASSAKPTVSLDSFASVAPGEARVLAWERLFAEWGAAMLAGDSATASVALVRADTIAQALERQRSDLTVRDAVRAIQTARGSPLEASLASAHTLFAHAQAQYHLADYEGADSSFARVVASRRLPAVLVQWAAVQRSATLAYRQRMAEGEALVRKTFASIDSTRAPALHGRASWIFGTILLRTARHDSGVTLMRMAQRSLTRANDRENAAAAGNIVGEELLSLGNEEEALALARRTLVGLERYPASVWRHNTLQFLLRAETGAGRLATARLVTSEDERVTRAIGNPLYLAESMIARARALLQLGDTIGERAAASAAHRYLDRSRPGRERQQLSADLRIVEATDLARVGGRTAIALLDSALAFFAPPGRALTEANAAKLVPLYLARASAYTSVASLDSARADLQRAAREFDRRSAAIASIPERAALAMRARGVVNQLVSLLVARGRPQDALAVVEWRRASFAARRPRIDFEGGSRARLRDPALSLSFVGDTLFTWTIVGDVISMTPRVVSHREVEARIVRVNEALEAGELSAVRDDLAWLYRTLTKAAVDALPDTAHRLTIVTDDDIAQAPFAAFWNEDAQRFLIERVAPQFARALWTRETPRRRVAAPTAALLADPAFADPRFSLLGRLPGARAEVKAIGPMYRDARITEGESVDTSMLVRELERATIVHFAGHTIFDERHPERSFLAVTGGALTTPRIGQLDLRGLELAVLSTCDASRAERSRAAGFNGITDAFLGAGADGVIGSTWRVADDRSMSVMSAFHRAYASSRDAATALRDAQLSLLRSPDAGLQSPAAWAAYRYIARSTQ